MSYQQPGPYGGQQPGPYGGGQQPGPYGPTGQPGYGYPQQPGFQQPPGYGHPPAPGFPQQPGHPQQPGYAQNFPQQAGHGPFPPPPARGGNGRTLGIVLGAVAIVTVLGVGAYFLLGGQSDDIADDGPHELTTPQKILDEYELGEDDGHSNDGDSLSEKEKKGLKTHGITAKGTVDVKYEAGTDADPQRQKALPLFGVYGTIEDPDRAIDGYFKALEKSFRKEDDIAFTGEAETHEPDALEGEALVKCREATVDLSESSDPALPDSLTRSYCVWADYSTLGAVAPLERRQLTTGRGTPASEAADLAARVRSEVRVPE